jgi:hypothetical protein
LAFALLQPQKIDDRAAKKEHEDERGDHRSAGAKRDVTKDVQERDLVGKFGQPIKHRTTLDLAPLVGATVLQ